MKKHFFFTLFAVILLAMAAAAAPKCVSYQARINDASGKALANTMVRLKASFIQDTLGATTYIEEHLVQTDVAGMLNASIGCGNTLLGSFETLDWGGHDYFLKIEIDTKGGSNFVPLTETKVLTVPMAVWAKSSGDWVKQDTFLVNNSLYDVKVLGELAIQSQYGPPHVALRINDHRGIMRSRISHSYSDDDGRAHTSFDVYPTNNGQAAFRFFRSTDTQGPKFIEILQGTNTTAQSARIGVGIHSYFNLDGGNFGIGRRPDDVYKLDVNGDARVGTLTVNGGDVAEARHPAAKQLLQPGMVVVFDENEQGKIRTTNRAYDKKVAGVISGAGKYFAGVCLLQEELAKGAFPLAQVGTVEVLCVGPVAVGDLLTTSSVPGYAMAVRKPLKGIGAAIGKATTTLKKGERGLVEIQVEKH